MRPKQISINYLATLTRYRAFLELPLIISCIWIYSCVATIGHQEN